MNQSERRLTLIKALLAEQEQYQTIEIPKDENEQRQFLRSLMNVRPPHRFGSDFLAVQDEYLQGRAREKCIVRLSELAQVREGVYLWQGDITTLAVDAIVNAANSGMTGCYCPCHDCIDNAIHTFAGIQLRLECAELMNRQGHEELTGQAKITKAYNLPCQYVLHTVGPIVAGKLKKENEEQLAACYRSCLSLADKNNLVSVAFCCISTGEFRFPNVRAAEIAIQTVEGYKAATGSVIKVVFNVFKDEDYKIYKKLLRAD